jgi:hypothetical protein
MNAHDILKYGHLWVHKHLDGLTDEQMQVPGVCGVWSVKEIIAHLASFEWVLAEVLLSFVDPGPTPTLDQLTGMDGDAFNAVQVGMRQDNSVTEVVSEYNEAYARVNQLLPRMDGAVLRRTGTIPWYGKEYSLDDFIVYQYYGHKREHMAQVAVYRDTLK